ncbi:hypothetical protein HYT23_02900 [Candidatus Pacearchaeota archaeon]|nr:hypothetical protein [Candidatus Pacearchaeota archaeon]
MAKRIDYDDDGKGNFSVAYYNNEDGVPDEIKTELSFYQVSAFHDSKGREVPLFRVEGLAKRLHDKNWREKIAKLNRGEAY